MIELLAQRTYGFEGTTALIVFTICFVGVVALTVAVVRLPLIGWLLAGVLMATALTAPTNADRTAYLPTWILPIQKNRAEMQLACGVMLGLLLLGTGRLNFARLPAQGWLLLLLGLFTGTMQFVHDSALNAGLSLAFAVATIPNTKWH